MYQFRTNDLYKDAISKWGIITQLWMVVEECSELSNAIAKYKRGRNNESDVIEELADVSIMVDQMSLYFGKEEFNRIKEAKLQRLYERVMKS